MDIITLTITFLIWTRYLQIVVVTKTVKSTFSCKNKINLVMEKLNA